MHLVRTTGGPALAVLATIAFVSQLGIAIMLPLYGLSLGASPTELGLLTSAFASLATAALWQAVDISAGIVLASVAVLAAGGILALLPRDLPAAAVSSASAAPAG